MVSPSDRVYSLVPVDTTSERASRLSDCGLSIEFKAAYLSPRGAVLHLLGSESFNQPGFHCLVRSVTAFQLIGAVSTARIPLAPSASSDNRRGPVDLVFCDVYDQEGLLIWEHDSPVYP